MLNTEKYLILSEMGEDFIKTAEDVGSEELYAIGADLLGQAAIGGDEEDLLKLAEIMDSIYRETGNEIVGEYGEMLEKMAFESEGKGLATAGLAAGAGYLGGSFAVKRYAGPKIEAQAETTLKKHMGRLGKKLSEAGGGSIAGMRNSPEYLRQNKLVSRYTDKVSKALSKAKLKGGLIGAAALGAGAYGLHRLNKKK